MIITKNKKEFRKINKPIELIDLAIEMNIFTESSKPISLHNIIDKLDNIMNKQELSLFDFRNNIKKIYTYKFNNTIDYWVERGFSPELAKEKITKLNSNAAKKLHEKRTPEERKKIAKKANDAKQVYLKKMKKENPDKLKEQFNTNIEFYLAKGLSQKDAEKALKERQGTFSKEKMIKKFGEEEGLKKVKDRNERWISSLKENNDWDEISSRKGRTYSQLVEKFGNDKANTIIDSRANSVGFFTASKESLKVFDPLIDWLFENHSIFYQDIYIGKEDSREFYIKGLNRNLYSYDFTIKSLNIIIEYNGEVWHPNPEWSKEIFESWKSPYSDQSAEEKRKYDVTKIEYVKSKGYEVLEIWSSKSPEENLEICKQFIKKLI